MVGKNRDRVENNKGRVADVRCGTEWEADTFGCAV